MYTASNAIINFMFFRFPCIACPLCVKWKMHVLLGRLPRSTHQHTDHLRPSVTSDADISHHFRLIFKFDVVFKFNLLCLLSFVTFPIHLICDIAWATKQTHHTKRTTHSFSQQEVSAAIIEAHHASVLNDSMQNENAKPMKIVCRMGLRYWDHHLYINILSTGTTTRCKKSSIFISWIECHCDESIIQIDII